MKDIKESSRSHPVIFCMLYLAGMILLKKLVMVPVLKGGNSLFVESLAELLILMAEIGVTIWMIYQLNLQTKIRVHKQDLGKAFLWALPGFFIVLFLGICNLDGNFWSDVPLLLVYAADNLSIGFMEEIIVRGLLIGVLTLAWKDKPHVLMRAALLSSFLFAIGHLGNLLTNPAVAVITQVLYAFFLGVFFAAIVIKGNNLWPAVIIHSLIDFVGGISDLMQSTQEAVQEGSQVAVQFALSDILLNPFVLINFVLFVYGICILGFQKKSRIAVK